MKARRALGLVLFALGCFGLGLAVARWTGWLTPPGPGPTVEPSERPEPLIMLDASTYELYDGSLTINPPEPPQIPEEQR